MVGGSYPKPTTETEKKMTEYGQLTAQLRTSRGKGVARQLRRQGLAPAVLYGGGKENVSLTLDPHLFGKSMDPERLYNTLFTITVETDGGTKSATCMVADIQKNAIRGDVMHIDFMRVDPEREVLRKIPVRYHGRAAGVMKGGKLKTFRRMVRVSAKPAELPIELAIDLAPLDSGEYLRVSDVGLPNATIVEPPNAPLAFVELPKAKKEEEEEGKK